MIVTGAAYRRAAPVGFKARRTRKPPKGYPTTKMPVAYTGQDAPPKIEAIQMRTFVASHIMLNEWSDRATDTPPVARRERIVAILIAAVIGLGLIAGLLFWLMRFF